MALTDCRECGHRVSDQARVCPSCGIGEPGNPNTATGLSDTGRDAAMDGESSANTEPKSLEEQSVGNTPPADEVPAWKASMRGESKNIQKEHNQIEVGASDAQKPSPASETPATPSNNSNAEAMPPTTAFDFAKNNSAYIIGGVVGLFVLVGIYGGGSSSSCNVVRSSAGENSYIINGQWDFGVSVYTTVRNTGKPRLVTIESMVSTSQGAWTRRKQVHLNKGESQRMEIFFEQPSISASNIRFTTKCV